MINGVRISGFALASLLNEVTDPRPDRWYNYRKDGDQIIVTIREEPPSDQIDRDAIGRPGVV